MVGLCKSAIWLTVPLKKNKKKKNVADRLSGKLAALFVSAIINKKAAVTLVLRIKINRSYYFLLILLFYGLRLFRQTVILTLTVTRTSYLTRSALFLRSEVLTTSVMNTLSYFILIRSNKIQQYAGIY